MRKLTKEEKARQKAFYQEKIDLLVDPDITVHMRQMNKMEDSKRKYFHWVCPVWKAVSKHIRDSKDCAFFDREGCMVSHRGTGVAINLNEIALCDFIKGGSWVTFRIQIEYWDEGCEGSWPIQSYYKTYRIDIPAELFSNFTKKAFNAWIKELKAKKGNKVREEELKQLKRLKKKYPEEA